jgi:hypothetical protein
MDNLLRAIVDPNPGESQARSVQALGRRLRLIFFPTVDQTFLSFG